jgi:prepilin signal peptidase PulO-like enzyme (type II secretory pathway)
MYTVVFLFFLLVGSFFNVVLFRKNTGISFVTGRSRCLSCNRNLQFFENIPLISFVVQGGRCRTCKTRLSWQYPLVELAIGLLGVLLWQLSFTMGVTPEWSFLSLLLFFFSLFLVAAYDIRTKIIDRHFLVLSLAGSILMGATRWFYVSDGLTRFFEDIFVALLLWLFFWGLWFLSGETWMGRGDSDVAFVIGLGLGFPKGLLAILFGFWVGAFVGILLIIVSSILHGVMKKTPLVHLKTEIPFAPFLALGALCALVYGDTFLLLFVWT